MCTWARAACLFESLFMLRRAGGWVMVSFCIAEKERCVPRLLPLHFAYVLPVTLPSCILVL